MTTCIAKAGLGIIREAGLKVWKVLANVTENPEGAAVSADPASEVTRPRALSSLL